MDKLSPEAQIMALKYLIEQDQLSKGSFYAAMFFGMFFAFIVSAIIMRLYSR